MSELFIPPDGAMQYVFHEFPDAPIWVMPKPVAFQRKLDPKCICTLGMRWVPFPHDEIEPTETDPKYQPCVCLCKGRIIE